MFLEVFSGYIKFGLSWNNFIKFFCWSIFERVELWLDCWWWWEMLETTWIMIWTIVSIGRLWISGWMGESSWLIEWRRWWIRYQRWIRSRCWISSWSWITTLARINNWSWVTWIRTEWLVIFFEGSWLVLLLISWFERIKWCSKWFYCCIFETKWRRLNLIM